MTDSVRHFQVFRLVWRQALRFPWITSIRLLCGVIWAAITSLQPYLMKDIINRLSSCGGVDVFVVLMWPVTIYLLSAVVQASSILLQSYVVDTLKVPQVRKRVAISVVQDLMQKPYRFFQDNFTGSVTNRIHDLMRAVPDLMDFFDRFFSHFLAFVVAVFFLGAVNIFFALFMIAWAALFFVGVYCYSGHLTYLSTTYSASRSRVTGHLVDFLTNVLTVRLFSSELTEEKSLSKTVDQAVLSEQRLSLAYLRMYCFFDYSFCLLQAVNFYLLCHGVEYGWLTIGDFPLVLVLNGRILHVLYRVSRDFSKSSKLFGQVLQAMLLFGDFDQEEDTSIPRDLADLKMTRGQIVFDHVRFHHADGVSLFDNKSVVIEAGQKVGLVGYSGAGKSTFVNLILGLYDLNGGHILLDGQDIQQVTKTSLRQAITMIPQDPSLFHRSLMENIRYGLSHASDKAVIAAAKQAHAHEFIVALEHGYDTLVGDRGVKLSGGQRQRIAIARAILKNSPILILDEATSQLDSHTESLIQDSLAQLMTDKTTLVIAHRLSTLSHMDRILVFHDGMIVEDGSHRQLLLKKGRYKALWDAQVGGFLPE